ncbi:MAG: DUF1203 domain-containing protein [Betaproteobacteria bacterium]|nr:DUF1203 domain-containing protein [Betaproteobacteria bacterium]
MTYRISGLDAAAFHPYRDQPDHVLAQLHAQRCVADQPHAYPCRVSLTDAEPGDTLILLNHEHLPADTPYRARHAIYINERSLETARFEDRVPAQLQRRLLSVRGFDGAHMMIDAEVVEGTALEAEIARQFRDARIEFLHVHFARRGCYAARVDRG